MAILKATRRYHNPLDSIKSTIHNKPLFNEKDWRNAVSSGTVDLYASALANSDNLKIDDFYKRYNLYHGDSQTRLSALYNEFGPDRTNREVRQIKKVDADGNLMTTTDAAGNIVPLYDEVEMSDYEYNKYVISETNRLYSEEQINNTIESIRQNNNNFLMFLADIGSVAGHFINEVGSIFDTGAAVFKGALDATMAPTLSEVDDYFMKGYAGALDTGLKAGVDSMLAEFEYDYTHFVDENGEYTTIANNLIGVASTLGQMTSSMIISAGTGWNPTAVFYTGNVFAPEVAQNYRQVNKDNNLTSLETLQILTKAGTTVGLQYGAEILLGKILGTSALDEVFWKRKSGSQLNPFSKPSDLTKRGIYNIVKSSVQEGLEEGLQETTDFLVNKGFHMFINENFNDVDWSWEDIGNAMLLGALVSVIGTSASILGTKRIATGEIRRDEAGTIITDKKGKAKVVKLGKIASWQYGLDMRAMSEAYNSILEIGKKIEDGNYDVSEELAAEYKAAYYQATATLRIISGIFGEIGTAKFSKAEAILKQITKNIDDGKFSESFNAKEKLEESLNAIDFSFDETFIEVVINNGVTNIKDKITKDDLDIDEEGVEKLKKIFFDDTKTVLISEDGDKISVSSDGKTKVIPEKELKNLSVSELILNEVDRKIIDYLTDNLTEQLIVAGKDYFGNDITNEEIACRLMTDINFFSSSLLSGNKDCYELLSKLILFKKKLSDKNIKDKVEKARNNAIINLWCKSLTEYCKIHLEADLDWLSYLNETERAKYEAEIRKERIGAEVYNKAITKNLSKNDLEFLINRINRLSLSKSVKTKLINQLQSNDIVAREKAIKRLLAYYSDLYYAYYDGVKYMPDDSIANRAFNSFLKSTNLYCETIINETLLSDSEREIILNKYGSINQDSILQFRNEQLKNYNGYNFKIVNGKVQIYKSGKAVGFSNFASIMAMSNEESLNRDLPTTFFKRNSILSKMLSKDVGRLEALSITIDDVILNPELLSATTQNNILTFAKEEYDIKRNKVDSELAYLYLRNYFLNNHDLGLTVKNNGEYVFVKYETMKKLIKADIITDRMSLEDIVDASIIPAGCKIKFIDNRSEAAYFLNVTGHPLENSVKLYDNTLYISKALLANQKNAKFTILHELIHAKQWENSLSAGMSYNWQKSVSPKKLDEILNNVEKHVPDLFKGLVNKDTKIRRLRDIVYYGSNEIQANGLEASKVYDYVPMTIKSGIDGVTVTFSWGYSFKLNEETSFAGTLNFIKNNIHLNGYFSVYNNKPIEDLFDPTRLSKLVSVLTDVTRSGEYLLLSNYKDKLVRLKEYFYAQEAIKKFGLQYMYYLYGNGKSYSEFLNSNIPCLVGSEYDKNSGLRIAYVGDNIAENINRYEESADIKWSLIPVKNIIGFIANGSRILIQNPKLFKMSDLEFKQERINNSRALANNLVTADEFLNDVLTVADSGIELGPKDINKFTDEELQLKKQLDEHKVSQAINAYIVADAGSTFNLESQEINRELKQNIIDDITPGYTDLSMRYAKELFAKDMDYKEFLDIDVPFMRIQKGNAIVDEQFVSLYGFGNIDTLNELLNVAGYPNNEVDALVIGTFKARNSMGYISNNEFIVNPEFLNIDKVYNFIKDVNGKIAFNINGTFINDETQDNTLPIIPVNAQERSKGGRFISVEELKATNDPRAEPGHETKNHKYTKRTLKGVTVYADGKFVRAYDYEWPDKPKRQVSKAKSKDTPLEPFYKIAESKGRRLQMSERLQKLILKTADSKLDKELQDKVDDGTLTDEDVIDYIKSNDDISDETFKIIKDVYFPDSPINSRAELNKYLFEYAPKYYALGMAFRVIDDKMGTDFYKRDIKPEELDKKIEQVKESYPQLYKDIKRVIDNYTQYHGHGIDIADGYARLHWLNDFTGAISEGHDVATNVRAFSIYKSKGFSLDKKLGSGRNARTVGETVADVAESFSSVDNMGYKELQSIVRVLYLEQNQSLINSGEMTIAQLSQEFNETFGDLPYDELKDYFNELAEELPNSKVLQQVIRANAEMEGLEKEQIDELTSEGVTELLKQKYNSVGRINSLLGTIKRNVPAKRYKYFIDDYSDILNDDLSLKKSAYKKKDGRTNDYDKLESIYLRIRELSNNAKAHAYDSKHNLEVFNANKKRVKKAVDNAVMSKKSAPKIVNKTVITYIVDNEIREFEINENVPPIVQSFLKTQLTNYAKTKVQLLSKDDEAHLVRTISEFIDQNAEVLNNLSQAEVDEMIDFYLNSAPFISGTSEAVYNTVQVLSIAYVLRMTDMQVFSMSTEKRAELEKFLENRISGYATGLAVWKNALKYIRPDDQVKEAMMRHVGIELDAEEMTYVHEMNVAIRRGDVAKAQENKAKLYNHILERNPKSKKSFLSKIVRYEQNAMLSGPGTWIRNKISNVAVTKLNKWSEYIGRTLADKKSAEGQYKLNKTPSEKVKEFVKVNVIDNGLLTLIRDNNLKYSLQSNSGVVGNTIEDLIQSSLMKEFGQNDKFSRFIRKMISDDKWVDKRFVWYLERMLEEDKVDLSEGLSQKVLDTIADAYVQAAKDYMHTDNALYQFERWIHNKGEVWYFAYKQLAPFMGASWNWFIEGINYTPLGLANSIVKLAKLEDTIEKAEAQQREGKNKNVNVKFTEFTLKRNLGKGVIGTTGFIIGALLAGFGFAKIDEDDDEYKLVIADGKYTIDISDLYGTQGILLGLTAIGGIKNQDKISDIVSSTFNQLLRDSAFESVITTFRPSDTPSDFAENSLYSITNMFVPNFLKTFSKIARKYNVQYSKGFLGTIERLVTSIPFTDRFFANKVDVYTGEKQLTASIPLLFNTINSLSPVDINTVDMSKNELTAISHGVKSSQLSGSYTVNGQKITLSAKETEELNIWYGKRNKDTLTKFLNNQTTKKVKTDSGEYKELKYSQMSEKEKGAAIDSIMSTNSTYAKIYILTRTGEYKYYASDSEYEQLKKLGITQNVYRKIGNKTGFVKN